MTWLMMCFKSVIIRPSASPSRPMSSSPLTSTATVKSPSEAALATFMSWLTLVSRSFLAWSSRDLLVDPLQCRGDQPADVPQRVKPALRRGDPRLR